MSFVDEQICAVKGAEMGQNTIKKYRLNFELLDMKRGKWLNKLQQEIIQI